MTFENPTTLSSDRGDLRMIVASGSFAAGETETLAYTLTLPADTLFLAGLEAASEYASIEDWYQFNAPSPIPANSEWHMGAWLDAPAGKHGRITRQVTS